MSSRAQLLRHPNIVAYYGVQRHAGVAVLVEVCIFCVRRVCVGGEQVCAGWMWVYVRLHLARQVTAAYLIPCTHIDARIDAQTPHSGKGG